VSTHFRNSNLIKTQSTVLELLRWDRHNDVWTVHHAKANSHNFQILFAEVRERAIKKEGRAFPMLPSEWFSPQNLVLLPFPWYCLAAHSKWMNCLILQAAVTFPPFSAETCYILSICRLHEKYNEIKPNPYSRNVIRKILQSSWLQHSWHHSNGTNFLVQLAHS